MSERTVNRRMDMDSEERQLQSVDPAEIENLIAQTMTAGVHQYFLDNPMMNDVTVSDEWMVNGRRAKEGKAERKEEQEIDPENEYMLSLKASARCGDMFSLLSDQHTYSDGRLWQERIPVFDVGLIHINIHFDTEGPTPISYNPETEMICNGSEGRDGDICRLSCPNLTPPIPRDQPDYDKDGKTDEFKCTCSVHVDNGESVCYWRPVEKVWKRIYTCNPDRVLPKRGRQRFRLFSWWKSSPNAIRRWETSVSEYNQFLKTSDMDRKVDAFRNLVERPMTFKSNVRENDGLDDFVNLLEMWPNEEQVDFSLNSDSEWLMLSDRLMQLRSLEDPTRIQKMDRQKFEKMAHLAKLVTTYQLNSGLGMKGFSSFVNYGCYCFSRQHDDIIMHNGQGQSVDSIDKACREYDLCTKCATIDSDEKCHPYRGYQYSMLQMYNETIEIDCNDNPDSGPANKCRHKLCECDRSFVNKLVDYQDTYSTTVHSSGGFDKLGSCQNSCKRNPATGKCYKYDQCCYDDSGSRVPYSSEGGNKQCCNDLLYDTNSHVCCDNSYVQPGRLCAAGLANL